MKNGYEHGCVVHTEDCGEAQIKNCFVLLLIDAAEPVYRSHLWLGHSPAGTHLSPTPVTQPQRTHYPLVKKTTQ